MPLSSPHPSSAACRRFDAALLSRTRDWTGRIGAQNRTSVVCVQEDRDEEWLSLLGSGRELGPCSIVVEDLDLRPGLSLRLSGRSLLFGDGRRMALSGAGQVLEVGGGAVMDQGVLSAQLESPVWPRLGRAGLLDQALAKALETLLGEIRRAGPLRSLRRLVGLGEGSTPSGDDMLVGVLAGLRRLAPGTPKEQGLRDAVAVLPDKASTPLGLQMLRQAAEGRFVEPLARLAAGLGSAGAAQTLEEDIRRLGAVGARSGTDMLTGLFFLARGECQ